MGQKIGNCLYDGYALVVQDAIPDISEDDLQAVAQWVFMNTMVDLELRIENPAFVGHRYHLLGVASILRKLLIDGGTLVGRVNRRYKLPLNFEIVPFGLSDLECHNMIRDMRPGQKTPELGKLPYWRMFFPGSLIPSDDSPGKSLTLPHFLSAEVGVVNRKRVSVRELVKFYCIVEGGVHIGDPRNQLEKDLLRTVPGELLMPRQGVEASPIGVLQSVAQIVKKALLPLMEAITNDPAPLVPLPGLQTAVIGESPFGRWLDGPDWNRES